MELSREEFEPGETLAAVIVLSTPGFENSTGVVMTYRIGEKGGSMQITEKTQTLSFRGKMAVIIEEELSGEYKSGDYVFGVSAQGLGEKVYAEEEFRVKKTGGDGTLLFVFAALLVLLTGLACIKRR
ncbi:MAG: hypothetical protein ACP5E4_02145 [Candidatus Aenigmatarchaeota archaeon]